MRQTRLDPNDPRDRELLEFGLRYGSADSGPVPIARELAEEFLLAALEANRPVLQAALAALAREYGISMPTLRRAAGRLGVESVRRVGRWWWRSRKQDRGEEGPISITLG